MNHRLTARLLLLLAALIALTACAAPAENVVETHRGPTPPGASLRLGRGSVNGAAWSNDGERVAVAGEVGVYLLDAATLEDVWRIPATAPVEAVAFAEDGGLIAAGLRDGTVALLDTADGAVLRRLSTPAEVRSLAWSSPDADGVAHFAAGLADGTVTSWAVHHDETVLSVEVLGTLDQQPGGATALAYSHDGRTLAVGSLPGVVRLYDAATARYLGELAGHDAYHAISGLAWSPDGGRLVSGARDGRVIVWDVVSVRPLRVIEPERGAVLSVAYAATGERFAALTEDGTATLWDAGAEAGGAEVHPVLLTNAASAAWSEDGLRLLATDRNGTLREWDFGGADDDEAKAILRGGVAAAVRSAAVAWSPDGTQVASGAGRRVLVWDAETGELADTLLAHDELVTSVAWSPDGTQLASASRDKTAILWDVDSGTAAVTLEGHTGSLSAVAWSPDGERIATAGGLDDHVLVWDAESSALLQTIAVSGGGAWSLAWSPSGDALAVGTNDDEIKLWRVTGSPSEGPFAVLQGALGWRASVAWSPDGARIASGGGDARITIWDAASGDVLATLGGHEHVVRGVAFSPDGERIASAAQDGAVIVQSADPDSGDQEPVVLIGHTDGVDAVAWSPDGARLASASDDGTVIVWEVGE